MAEIYINQTAPIKTKIFWGGELIDPDNNQVTATVYDITEEGISNPTIDPTTPVLFIDSDKLETDNATYYIILPISLCRSNKSFKIVWEYTINNISASHVSFTDVVTPYANLSDVWDDLNFGTDQSDPNYKSYHDVQMAEKYARKLIESYTAQKFYTYYDEQIVYGGGEDILSLPFKISIFNELYENDVLVYDRVEGVLNWLYTPITSESGFGIRVDKTQMIDNTVYTANGLVPPTVNDSSYQNVFKKDYRYKVGGYFGWSNVPDNVEEACIILIKQFFEKDTAWRNKYVKNISAFDWQFEYMEDAHRGTGNLYADQLLLPYVINGIMVI